MSQNFFEGVCHDMYTYQNLDECIICTNDATSAFKQISSKTDTVNSR